MTKQLTLLWLLQCGFLLILDLDSLPKKNQLTEQFLGGYSAMYICFSFQTFKVRTWLNLHVELCSNVHMLISPYLWSRRNELSGFLGLFSDVHVLALMYCGEMCFWYHTYAKSSTATEFDAKSTGVKLLRDYINAVKGPLSGKGWNCDRAEQLIKVLQDTWYTAILLIYTYIYTYIRYYVTFVCLYFNLLIFKHLYFMLLTSK